MIYIEATNTHFMALLISYFDITAYYPVEFHFSSINAWL